LFPFGSDFSEVEQRLLPALNWLQSLASHGRGKWQLLRAVIRPGLPVHGEHEALQRMDLLTVSSLADRLLRRALLAALRRTGA
jgi:predicted cupin superfamily sugar epimerase